MKNIKAVIKDKGFYCLVSIVEIEKAFTKRFIGTNFIESEEDHETEILTFGKYFDSREEAETFIKSDKKFKKIFKIYCV